MATLTDPARPPVMLAGEPRFRLGGIEIEPASRQVRRGDESETLEPRVMQALVVLGRAAGRIVGRDELIARCWNGRVVGDNAINRVVSLLRALAERTGAFRIETINKVGYRLTPIDIGERASPAPIGRAARSALLSRRTLVAGAAAALASGGCLIWLSRRIGAASEAEHAYQAGIESERMGEAGLGQAVRHYRAAVAHDPGHAAAWGALSRALAMSAELAGDAPSPAIIARAEEASGRALRLDPRNADALSAHVLVTPTYRNWLTFQRRARDALAMRPEMAVVRSRLAQSLADTGQLRAARDQLERAVGGRAILPAGHARLGWLWWQTGNPAKAREILDWAFRTWPLDMMVWTYRQMFLALSGATDAALAMTSRNEARPGLGGPFPPSVAAVCTPALAADAGATERQRAIDALTGARATGDVASFVAIPYLARLGAVDAAFAQSYGYLLGRRDPVTGERFPLPSHAGRWTDFLFVRETAAMRVDPRFERLIGAIGLTDYWRQANVMPDFRRS